MFWLIQSIWAKLFLLYLALVSVLTVVNLTKVVFVFFPLSRVGRFSLQNVCDGEVSADLLVKSALTGRLPKVEVNGTEPQPSCEPSLQQTLRQAVGEFRYTCDHVRAKIRSARRVVVLTLILAALVFVLSLSDVVRGAWAITNPVEPNSVLFRENLHLSFGPLQVGLLFSAIFYVLSAIQEDVLNRRQSKWEHFCVRISGGEGSREPH